jgi:excisionase family DNA binding protein
MQTTTKYNKKAHKMSNYEDLLLLTTKDVSKILQVTERQVVILIKTGEIPAHQFNARVYRVKKVDLESYIESKMYQVQTL